MDAGIGLIVFSFWPLTYFFIAYYKYFNKNGDWELAAAWFWAFFIQFLFGLAAAGV